MSYSMETPIPPYSRKNLETRLYSYIISFHPTQTYLRTYSTINSSKAQIFEGKLIHVYCVIDQDHSDFADQKSSGKGTHSFQSAFKNSFNSIFLYSCFNSILICEHACSTSFMKIHFSVLAIYSLLPPVLVMINPGPFGFNFDSIYFHWS